MEVIEIAPKKSRELPDFTAISTQHNGILVSFQRYGNMLVQGSSQRNACKISPYWESLMVSVNKNYGADFLYICIQEGT
jgi:hypothetical protein